jgi:hypothetical protein
VAGGQTVSGPVVSATTRLPGTADQIGPYTVQATVEDLEGTITAVNLRWRLAGQTVFQTVPMHRLGGTGTVSGQITDGGSGLADAQVDFFDQTGAAAGSVFSGALGFFSVSLPEGPGFLTVSLAGYVSARVDYTVLYGGDVALGAIALSPESTNPGDLVGAVRDAFSGSAVDTAEVLVRAGWGVTEGSILAQTVTDETGEFSFHGLQAGSYTLQVRHAGYVAASENVVVMGDSTVSVEVSLAPIAAGDDLRIVLTWDDGDSAPADLDAHLVGPADGDTTFHVFYADRGATDGEPFAALDLDGTAQGGQETVTLTARRPGTYRYAVLNYTDRNEIAGTRLSELSGARVRVYRGSDELADYLVPADQAGNEWQVFELDGATGTVTPVGSFCESGSATSILGDGALLPDKPYSGAAKPVAKVAAGSGPVDYWGAIPGQIGGSTVQYFVEAIDDGDRRGTEPADAPDSCFAFAVAPVPALRTRVTSVAADSFPTVAFTTIVVGADGRPVAGVTADDVQVMEDDAPATVLSVTQTRTGGGSRADVIFIFDDTGSMMGTIDGLKVQVSTFAAQLAAAGVDYGLGLVTFKDNVTVRNSGDLYPSVAAFQAEVNTLFADGGADTPENALDAIGTGMEQIHFRAGAQRVFILITDAPFQTPESPGDAGIVLHSYALITEQLRTNNVTLYVVGPPSTGGYDNPFGALPSLPLASGGSFYPITGDFSSIIDALRTMISSTYEVRYLTPRPTADGTERVVHFEVHLGADAVSDTDRYVAPQPQGWVYSLNARARTDESAQVRFGIRRGASVGLDRDLGEEELPPRPPTPSFDVRWNGHDALLGTLDDYLGTDVLTTGATWHLTVQADADQVPVHVTWDPASLPTKGSLRLRDAATGGTRISADLRRQSEAWVREVGLTELEVAFDPRELVSFRYDLPARWSLVSLPCEAPDSSVSALFPTAISLFRYEGGYQHAGAMEPGIGYWVNLPAPASLMVTGPPFDPTRLARALPAKWTLVGPGDAALSVDELQRAYPALVSAFGFSGGYVPATVLSPGAGYWVNMAAPSVVDLSGAVARAGTTRPAQAPGPPAPVAGPVLWVEGPGGSQAIRLGVAAPDLVELPPVPPAGLFDVRVEADGVGTWAVPAGAGAQAFALRWQGDVDRLRWRIPAGTQTQWQVRLGEQVIDLVDQGQVDLSPGLGVTVASVADGRPGIHSLQANYPNPFNPTTTISYTVGSAGKVELLVFAAGGQRVRELLAATLAPGQYQAVWDGRDDAGVLLANGVYVCQLRIGDYRAEQKMLLMK